jgi:hypothetical protein
MSLSLPSSYVAPSMLVVAFQGAATAWPGISAGSGNVLASMAGKGNMQSNLDNHRSFFLRQLRSLATAVRICILMIPTGVYSKSGSSSRYTAASLSGIAPLQPTACEIDTFSRRRASRGKRTIRREKILVVILAGISHYTVEPLLPRTCEGSRSRVCLGLLPDELPGMALIRSAWRLAHPSGLPWA